MKLSIVVPVFNTGKEKLEFCLDSLLAQTITDYEIITVNDASTDNSLEILQTYKKRNPDKIRVINLKKNIKQGGARNIGIKHSRGQFIAFVDSDDWCRSDMYEILLQKAFETKADIVDCDAYIKYQQDFEVGQISEMLLDDTIGFLNDTKYKKLILHSGSVWSKIYKRELFIKNNVWFPENVFYEDNSTVTLLLLYATHIEKVAMPLYFYFMNPTSVTHKKNNDCMFDRLITAELLIKEAKKRGFYDLYKEELEYIFVKLYYANTLLFYQRDFEKLDYSRLAEMRRKKHSIVPNFNKNKYKKNIGKKLRVIMKINDISPWLYIAVVNVKKFVKQGKI